MVDNSPNTPLNKGAPTALLVADESGISAAAECLRAGGLVGLPTETVYGLAADARNGEAVARIFEAKGRPSFNPLSVHVASVAAAEAVAEFPPVLRSLAANIWPGPLTVVAPLRAEARIADLVTAGGDHVAVRVPAHPAALAVLDAFGGPVAAPSANVSGKISPTRAEHVASELGNAVDAVLDGGACDVGLESTILRQDGDDVLVLRPGALPNEDIVARIGRELKTREGGPIDAPGQLASHYAPSAMLRLDAEDTLAGELLLGFGPLPAGSKGVSLSETKNLREAAANLFGHLRALDDMAARDGATGIAVSPIPDHHLGRAINDRLRRAAAPRGAEQSRG